MSYSLGTRPKICVLGSRDNMCINEEVLKAPSAGRGNICRQKIAKKACEYHANVETVRFQQENEILDVCNTETWLASAFSDWILID